MACEDIQQGIDPKNIKSVSAGNESVQVDTDGVKAESVSQQNSNLRNIHERLVDPMWRGLRSGRLSGW